MGKRMRAGSPRGLAACRRARRQTWMGTLTTEVAALEGQLMATLGLDLEQLEIKLYGGEYLTPWEKQDALLQAASEVRV